MTDGLSCEGVRVGEVLRDFALTVAPGEVVALTAPSGAGKSTLLRAIVRLVALDGGVVRLDGVDVATLDPRVLRRRVAFVAQRPVMLPGTVADNLAYGLDEPPELHKALDAAGGRRASAASTSSSCVLGFAFGMTCATVPSPSMMNVARCAPMYVLPYIDFCTHTP